MPCHGQCRIGVSCWTGGIGLAVCKSRQRDALELMKGDIDSTRAVDHDKSGYITEQQAGDHPTSRVVAPQWRGTARSTVCSYKASRADPKMHSSSSRVKNQSAGQSAIDIKQQCLMFDCSSINGVPRTGR